MGAHQFLKDSANITDANGFVTVDQETLQHTKYPNIFAFGDCSNVPTSKTASAVAAQLPIVRYRAGKFLGSRESIESGAEKNFSQFVSGDGPIYDGYTSCPLPVGFDKGVIAEFNYKLEPQETMFYDQSVPGQSNYYLKRYAIPFLYWNMFLQGNWEGPASQRKFWNPLGW